MIALDDLASAAIFLRWKLEPNEKGALTKVPYSPHGVGKASHATRSHWGTLAQASAALQRWGGDGLGIVAAAVDDEYVHGCLDIDGCYPTGSDQRGAWVNPIATILHGCYRELSWSGTGEHFHFLVRREVAAKRRWRINAKRPSPGGAKDHGFELAVSVEGGYYLTCTRAGEGELRVVEESELQALYDAIAAFRPESRKQRKARTGPASPDPDSHARTLAAIAALENDGRFADRDAWCVIGMAVHHGTGGSDAGLRAWTAWTERLHADAENACARAWATFTPGGGTTVATLFKFARENGFEPRRRRNGHDHAPSGAVPQAGDQDDARPLSPDGSEDALALELVDRHGHELRHVARFGRWFHWDGRRWAEDETVAIYDLCRAIARVRAFIDEGTALGRKLASATTVSGIERLARSDRRVALIMGRLDADPAILNTPGGIVDLRTGAIGPSNPAALCSQITAVAPAPDHEDCPAWKAALDLYLKHDNEMVAYLQRFAGYCLWGALVDQVVVFAHGKGGNGKGTYFNTMLRIMGGYARNAPSEVFLTTTFDRHPTELARLHNARLVVASEIEKGRRWNMTRLNSMSGGDTVTARFMRQDDFEYAPKFKLALFANNKPNFGKVDEAVRRRLHLVAFDHVVTDRDRAADPGFDARIKAEWPAILRWAINGCLDWQREGLNPPQKVIDASAEYLANQNNVAVWLADGCVEDAGATATLRDLFASWSSWCEANGERPGSSRALAKLLEEAGFSRVRIGKASTRSHAGLRLATT